MFPASSKGGGQCATTGPLDVCKIPAPPAPFAPAPFPNIAQVAQASGTVSQVLVANKDIVVMTSSISRSNGDEAGTLGGMVSMVNMSTCKWIKGSSAVFAKGKPVVHVTLPTTHNGSSPNTVGLQVAPSQVNVLVAP